jgi:hypothetical protein
MDGFSILSLDLSTNYNIFSDFPLIYLELFNDTFKWVRLLQVVNFERIWKEMFTVCFKVLSGGKHVTISEDYASLQLDNRDCNFRNTKRRCNYSVFCFRYSMIFHSLDVS